MSTERNDPGVDAGASRPAVLRFDVSGAAASLTATRDWNLTGDIPGLSANGGLEAIAWVPDDLLVSKGFLDETAAGPYNPATYPNHGAGLFFVGVEATGEAPGSSASRSRSTSGRTSASAPPLVGPRGPGPARSSGRRAAASRRAGARRG